MGANPLHFASSRRARGRSPHRGDGRAILCSPFKAKPMTSTSSDSGSIAFRLRAFLTLLICASIGLFAIYWLITHVLPIYGQMRRLASAIEVPYMAFGLLMAPPVMFACVVASAFAICTGERFAPSAKSVLGKLQNAMLKASVYSLIAVAPPHSHSHHGRTQQIRLYELPSTQKVWLGLADLLGKSPWLLLCPGQLYRKQVALQTCRWQEIMHQHE
jgi:hypothetical protein